LQEGDEQCRVLGLRAGGSLLVLLLAERSVASAQLLTGLSEVALPSLKTIAQNTASELADAKQGHIPGYRCLAPAAPRKKSRPVAPFTKQAVPHSLSLILSTYAP
jgi:hypothetical protein